MGWYLSTIQLFEKWAKDIFGVEFLLYSYCYYHTFITYNWSGKIGSDQKEEEVDKSDNKSLNVEPMSSDQKIWSLI